MGVLAVSAIILAGAIALALVIAERRMMPAQRQMACKMLREVRCTFNELGVDLD